MNIGGILEMLVTSIRNKLDDNTPSEQRWSDVEIVEYINKGEVEVARRAYDLEDSTTESVCVVTVQTNVASYSLHNKVIAVKRAKFSYNNLYLNKRTTDWLHSNRPSWEMETGLPSDFIVDKNNLILTPTPTSTYNGYYVYLSVYRLPLNDLGENNFTPEVHSKYYDDLINWACFDAKMKRDADTFDPEGAITFLGLFEKSVGTRPTGNIERVVKEQPDYLRIQVRR